MRPRTRIVTFGSAALLALAGALCAAFAGGVVGLVLGVILLSFGLGGAVLLAFLEVGLSEDHARAREEQRQRSRTKDQVDIGRLPWSRRLPRRPG